MTPIEQPDARSSVDPSGRLPQWAAPLASDDLRAYRDRLDLKIGLDSLERSLRGDTAAHAKWREQALKSLGLGQRVEVDITARQDRDWLRDLTDEELMQLKTLKDLAMARKGNNGGTERLIPAIDAVPGVVDAITEGITLQKQSD